MAPVTTFSVLLGLAGLGLASASESGLAMAAESRGNPIRKVVTLMQDMQKEVEETGKKEKELFDKFMCFCQNGDAELKASVVKASGAITALTAKLGAEAGEKTQLVVELKQHEQDKAAAQKDLNEASTMREKEGAEHKATVTDLKTNMAGVDRAIPALEKGMGGAAFMQMPGANALANLLDTFPFSNSDDRSDLLAFVQQSGDYVPASGQIVGILKGMKDTMQQQLAEAEKDEAGSASSFDQLKKSKESEVQIATEAITSKTKRSGELAVSLAEAKDSLEDNQAELEDTEKLAESLTTQCATKQQEWDEREKVRSQEILAISEAIGIMNDDDALDTFKKAIPSANLVQMQGSSFLQRSRHSASPLVKVQRLLAHVANTCSSQPVRLMLYTVSSKLKLAQGASSKAKVKMFEDIIKQIGEMVAHLDKSQDDDDSQRDYCREEFHKSEGEEKKTTRALDKVKNRLDERNDMVEQLEADIASLTEGIKELDKNVALATEQRKEEHAESVQSATMNQAALGLVEKAKNRLNKFYAPSEYKAPPTTTPSSSPYGFIQLSSNLPEAPEAFAPQEKGSQSTGVLMMMDQIMHGIEKDIAEGKADEKEAQKDYTELMNDSATSRSQDAKSITDKEASKAQLKLKIERDWEKRRSTEDQLALIQQFIRDLHGKCDFLMKSYDERKEARATSKQSLEQAKATLAGAEASF